MAEIVASDRFTGEGGYVEQLGFSNIGEQRQWGMILHHMAALAYIPSSTLVSHRNVIVKADFNDEDEAGSPHLNRNDVVYPRCPAVHVQPPQLIENIRKLLI